MESELSPVELPPGPKPRFPQGIRNLMSLRADILSFLQRLNREYGDISYFRVAGREIFFVNDPEFIQEILVTHDRNFVKSRGLEMAKRVLGNGLLTSEGEFHRRQRRMVQPAFHAERVNRYAPVMVEYAQKTEQRWRHGAKIDAGAEMMRLTLNIAAKTLFDADVEGEAEEIGRALSASLQMFTRIFNPFANLLEMLPLPSNYRFAKSKARLDATIYRMISERRKEGRDHGDFLSMLLRAQDEEGSGGLNDQQIRDEAMTIFLAGHETTANALTWTWYLLSQNPEAEAKMHAEIDSVLGERVPEMSDLPHLTMTRKILAESMRLYPPAYVIGRKALQDYPLGKYCVPANATILMSQFVMHRDERFYPDPLKFDPERWADGGQSSRPRFSYFPFGAGPRVCIGEAFAWMEATLLLATLGRHWRMRHVEGHRVATQPLITLRPRYGMLMTLQKR
jgi:cytochrome P450